MDVAAWLQGLGFERYARNFEENHIDAEVLVSLTEADLKELGIWSLGHRRKLMAAIATLDGRVEKPTTFTGAATPAARPEDSAPRLDDSEPVVHVRDRPECADEPGPVEVSREPGERDQRPDPVHRPEPTPAQPRDHGTRAPRARQVAVIAVEPAPEPGAADRIRHVLVDHGARISTTPTGQLLATFGSETDTEGQIDCALQAIAAIEETLAGLGQDRGREILVSMGIDGGMVSGEDAATSIAAIGSMARTLATVLADGGTAASKTVVDAADTVRWRPLGEVEGGSREGTVRAWHLMPSRPISLTAGETPLAGRQGEISHFSRVIDSCLAGRRGQGVMILGGAGTGKSRLVGELAALAVARGFRHVSLHNSGPTEREDGDAIAALAAALLDLAPESPIEERRKAIDRVLDNRIVDYRWRAGLNDILCVPHDPECRAVYELLDGAGREGIVQSALRALLRATAASTPMLVTIEDIHLASNRTTTHLAGLVRSLDDQMVVVAATARKESAPLPPEWIASIQHVNARTIQLDGLAPDDANALAASYGDIENPEVLQCIGHAKGNPALLEQLLLARQAGQPFVARATMEGLIRDRVEGLSDLDRRALRAASVVGQCVPLAVLQTMIGNPRYDAANLVSERFLHRVGGLLYFAQGSLCTIVYGSLDRDERQDLHALAARTFAGKDNTLYARHLEKAADSTAPRAYAQAAESHLAELRYGRALALVRQGLQIVSLDEDRFHLECLEGDCLFELGTVQRSVDAFKSARDLATTDAQRCRADIGIARGYGDRGRYAEALEILAGARSVAEGGSLVRELARIHNFDARFSAPVGRVNRAEAHYEQALEFARRGAMPEEVIRASRGLGQIAEIAGRMSAARSHYVSAVETAKTHELARLAVENGVALVRVRYYLDPLSDVLDHALTVANAAARIGHDLVEIEARLVAAAVLYDLGKHDLVLEHFDRAQDLGEGVDSGGLEPALASIAARSLMALDRRDEARDLLGAALKAAREAGLDSHGGVVLGAVVMLARGRRTRDSAFAEAEMMLQKGASSHSHLRFYRDAIDAALGSGSHKLAARFAGLLEQFTRAEKLPWAEFVIARGRALAAHGGGRMEPVTARELRHLIDRAKALEYVWAQKAIRAALDDLRRGGGVPTAPSRLPAEPVRTGDGQGPPRRPDRRRT